MKYEFNLLRLHDCHNPKATKLWHIIIHYAAQVSAGSTLLLLFAHKKEMTTNWDNLQGRLRESWHRKIPFKNNNTRMTYGYGCYLLSNQFLNVSRLLYTKKIHHVSRWPKEMLWMCAMFDNEPDTCYKEITVQVVGLITLT